MATISRYTETTNAKGGLRTAKSVRNIRRGVRSGAVKVKERVLQEGQRLDVLAQVEYGDGRLWWVIAAASDIGWAMQAPPGTLIKIPNLSEALRSMK